MLAGRILAAATMVASFAACAAERVDVCARESGGRPYKVSASKVTGSELNTATKTYDYDALSTYVVIFWQQNQASVIKLDFPMLNPIGVEGVDQQGRHWNVSTNLYCF